MMMMTNPMTEKKMTKQSMSMTKKTLAAAAQAHACVFVILTGS